jgi:hypothetical protein
VSAPPDGQIDFTETSTLGGLCQFAPIHLRHQPVHADPVRKWFGELQQEAVGIDPVREIAFTEQNSAPQIYGITA